MSDTEQRLVNLREARKAKEKMAGERIENLFDVDDADDGDPEEGQEQADAAPPARTSAPAPAADAPRKMGRPKGSKTRRQRPEETASSDGGPPKLLKDFTGVDGFDPHDVTTAWPEILDDARTKGLGPEYISIQVIAIGEGMHPTPPENVGVIDGEEVRGDETINPGQALVAYITNVIHMGRKGPVKYKLKPYLKSGRGNFGKQMTLRLSHPDEIRAREKRRQDWEYQQRLSAMQTQGRPPIPPPAFVGTGGYPQAAQSAPATQTLPAPAPVQSQMPQMTDFVRQMAEYEQYRQQLLAAGQPAPPPAPQVVHVPAPAPQAPPPRMTEEERELIEEAKFMRRLEKSGYVKATGMGAVPQAAAQAAQNPVTAVRELLSAFRDIKKMEGEVKSVFGVEDVMAGVVESVDEAEKPKIVELPAARPFGRPIYLPQETDGWVDWAQKAVLANAETSSDLALKMIGGLSKSVDGTSFGRLIDRLLAHGGAPAAIAQQARASGITGTGQPPPPPQVNGAPPPMRFPRGPTA